MHIGENIRRVRELLGIKADYLAKQLKINQKTLSRIEQSEMISEKGLLKIAEEFGLPVTLIKAAGAYTNDSLLKKLKSKK